MKKISSAKFLQVFISAENKNQANKILDSLLKKKLVSGGLFLRAPARFWWKDKIIDMNYYNISTFTVSKNKKAIIESVNKTSVEEVPMVWFVSFEGNEEFIKWIHKTVL